MNSTRCNLRHNYAAKQNIATSFTLTDLTCSTCVADGAGSSAGTGTGHKVLHREGERVKVIDLTHVAFVVMDQNFPPAVPVLNGECLKIFRIEDASPLELVGAFLEATRGFIVPSGSVVVLSSASHLAWVGAAAYARDYIAARLKLRAAFRGGIEVLHGISIFGECVTSTAAILAIRDNLYWLKQLDSGRDVSKRRDIFLSLACTGSDGSPSDTPGSPLVPGKSTASPLAAVEYHLSLVPQFGGQG
jgi:hypothetical protein